MVEITAPVESLMLRLKLAVGGRGIIAALKFPNPGAEAVGRVYPGPTLDWEEDLEGRVVGRTVPGGLAALPA